MCSKSSILAPRATRALVFALLVTAPAAGARPRADRPASAAAPAAAAKAQSLPVTNPGADSAASGEFLNRVGPSAVFPPSAAGSLPTRPAAPVAPGPGRRAIELASGYVLAPGEAEPAIPSALRRGPAAPAGAAALAASEPSGRDAYIVQFGDDSPDSARARITRVSGSIAWPLANEGWLVRMDADAAARLGAGTGAPWVARYEPAYKLSAALDVAAPGAVAVTALLFADADDDATLAALRALGATQVATKRSESNHLARFTLDRARLADAAALAGLAWLEPTPVYTKSNDLAQWVVQSGVQNSRPVSDHGLRGQGQVLMISDSGVRTNHEMFFDSTRAIDTWGDFPSHRKIIAYKPASAEAAFGDAVGYDYHGTHTSGTLAGDPSPTSNAPWSGMAPKAKLYFVDAGGPDGGSLFLPDDLNDLFRPSYVGNAGGAARISSNSWGDAGAQGSYTLASMETDQFVWDHPDYLVAFASGNNGVFASVNAPATAKNCLTVGATGNGTNENKLASFSSRGPARDGRRKPTVMGPGDGVTSSIGSTRYTYATYSGTSMATPAVAGAMTLVRQYLADGWYPTGTPVAANRMNPSAALLRAMAVAAARNDISGFRAPDNTIGYGRLTIDDVLYFPGDSSRTVLVDPSDGLDDGRFVEYQVQVTDPSRPLKVALCWTDAPGNPAAQLQLVNDLDLVVTHGGATYRGNYLLNNASVDGGTRDSLNVEELVRLPAPEAGLYTVRIEAHRVVQGPQRFALCVTGGVGSTGGAIALDRFQYGLGDRLEIEVVDGDATGPLTAHVTSTTEPAGEQVTLSGSNGVFRGSIVMAPVPVNAGDGTLAVSSGDAINAVYTDGSPGTTAVTAAARIDVQAPMITNVHAVALGTSRARVTWTTDLGATSLVRFGTTTALASVADSAGFTRQHTVLLDGLSPGTLYRYDVESATARGVTSRDSLGGAHRSFTMQAPGSIALVMDDPSTNVLATWTNALAALGWSADVLPKSAIDPPLVGNTAKGLRHYDAVLWQVDPDRYPPFSDAQRAAIDSLLDGGGRLLVTGHDIGFGLSDAGSPTYSPEREAWLEHSLKSRYFSDNFNADTLTGRPGSPVTGAYTAGLPYALFLYPDSGDNIGAAPNNGGTWYGDWTEDFLKFGYIGMRWESAAAQGTPGIGVWGGKPSRLVGLFYEWRALSGSSTAHLPARTGVLQDATSWLMGHRPPEVHLVEPAAGAVITGNTVNIHYSVRPDVGRAIAAHVVECSLDGGETWAPVPTAACSDSGCSWDLTAAPATPNSANVRVRVRVIDDGTPALHTDAGMTGSFTIARAGGDARGPVVVAGSVSCSPTPIRLNQPTTLSATFSDAERGGGLVSAAEYSIGSSPAAAGAGVAMSGTFGAASVQASVSLPTASITSGNMRLWLRARDGAGNWGTPAALDVITSGTGFVSVEPHAVDFLAAPSPNPSRGSTAIRFGLARDGAVSLELYDLAGRRVRVLASGVLPAGEQTRVWDGRDSDGGRVRPGVYFVRLVTPERTFRSRLVAVE